MTDPAWDTAALAALDKRHCWHPFTAMAEWSTPGHQPLLLTGGDGAWLTDSDGIRYLDGNSSIWTNIHGHCHPRLSATIAAQAATLSHASFLGFSNPWAVRLAARLAAFFPGTPLQRVFFSDDGSTAIECAVKIAIQCRQLRGESRRLRFAAFDQAYHGDTLGASSLGGVSAFHERFSRWGLQPLRLHALDDLLALDATTAASLNAVVIEPLIQGVNRMRLWPTGMLRQLRDWCDTHGVFLILDEVMTGFGRTGRMFACQHEDVVPDFLCLAKGITGGTLPLAATIVRDEIFATFLAANSPDHVFAYGHSYCGNPLGCAAALTSLDIFDDEAVLESLPAKAAALGSALATLQQRHPGHIAATRQLGMVAAVDLVAAPGQPYPPASRAGARVCLAARRHGLLTRPILDTIVIMPPLCISTDEIGLLASAISNAIADTLA